MENYCYNIYMKYVIKKDKIGIISEKDFSPKDILECGQIFRFKKLKNGYRVFSLDKTAVIQECESFDKFCQEFNYQTCNTKSVQNDNVKCYKIITDSTNYFANFFDFNTDYNIVKKELISCENFSQIMSECINYASGIRILNQDFFEALISFVISQNNNIKRIQKIIENICSKYGTNMGNFYAFPTPIQLQKATEQELVNLGAGYRAKYILNAVDFYLSINPSEFVKTSTELMEKTLLSVNGIGQKVCDCVMLFGCHNLSYFPVDTWNEKVYNEYFAKFFESDDALLGKKASRIVMRERFVKIFGKNSGIAQQYLFNYERLRVKK